MIVVDTSAVMAIALDEPAADRCMDIVENDAHLAISAATLSEALIVGRLRGVAADVEKALGQLDLDIVTLTPARARLAADAYATWGKGIHRARLNYGDCFAYALAKERDCPLLFIGDDFARTDIKSALDG